MGRSNVVVSREGEQGNSCEETEVEIMGLYSIYHFAEREKNAKKNESTLKEGNH